MNVLAPNVKNLVRGGAIIYFDRGNLGYYRDLGNVPTFTASTPTNFVEHKTSRSGVIVMDRREPTEFSNLYKFGIEELNVKNLELLFNSTPSITLSQGATSGTFSVTNPVLDSAYDLSGTSSAFSLTSLVAHRSTTITLTPGVDFILEADLGMITFPSTGAVQPTDTVSLTFNKPAITGDILYPLSKNASITGACLAFFRTSDGRLWLRKHTNVQMSFPGDTAFTGTEFAKSDGELLYMPDGSNPAQPFGTLQLIPAAA